MNKTLQSFFYKDNNNTLGAVRLTFAIFGSLTIAYLIVTLIAKYLQFSQFENIVMGVILLPLFWSMFGLWIVMSKTKFYSVLKTILSTLVLCILLFGVQ